MEYRWGPVFEYDCKDPEYVRRLKEEDAFHARICVSQAQKLEQDREVHVFCFKGQCHCPACIADEASRKGRSENESTI